MNIKWLNWLSPPSPSHCVNSLCAEKRWHQTPKSQQLNFNQRLVELLRYAVIVHKMLPSGYKLVKHPLSESRRSGLSSVIISPYYGTDNTSSESWHNTPLLSQSSFPFQTSWSLQRWAFYWKRLAPNFDVMFLNKRNDLIHIKLIK